MEPIKEKLLLLVESRIGNRVDLKIEESFRNNTELDVEKFAQELINEEFTKSEIESLKEKLLADKNYDTDLSVADTEEFLDGEGLDLSTLSFELPVVEEGDEVESSKQLLQSFEYLSVDEILSQATWVKTRQILQTMLIPAPGVNSEKMPLLSLKIFKRLLSSAHSPKAVCEGFVTLSETASMLMDSMNRRGNTVEAEDLYDIRGSKVYHRSSQRRRIDQPVDGVQLDVLIRSMYLIMSAHDNMPGNWLRFNEKRLHEIIFAFVDMLNTSFFVENGNVSGFDIATALQPRGSWCKHWVHSSTGRKLLCQSLRKHSRFFHSIVDTVIAHIVSLQDKKTRKQSGYESRKSSAKASPQVNILGFSSESMAKGRFSHCFAIVTYIVQYKVGRALFPFQTASRRRPWTVQDVIGLMIDYVEMSHGKTGHLYSPFYVHHLLDMAKILLSVEEEVSTARGKNPRRHR